VAGGAAGFSNGSWWLTKEVGVLNSVLICGSVLAEFVHISPSLIYDEASERDEYGVQIIYALPSKAPEKAVCDIVSMHDLQLLYRIHFDQQHSPDKAGVVLTRVCRPAGLVPIEVFLCVCPPEEGLLKKLLQWLLPAS
jgi:hypothetical protein